MPQVTMKTGFATADGQDEELTEYLCDWSDCPNIATEVVGCVREFGLSTVVCHEHAARLSAARAARTDNPPPLG
jgi:hypothetical protein